MHRVFLLGVLVLCPVVSSAQSAQVTLHISVESEATPLTDAEVVVLGETHSTDDTGRVTLSVEPGPLELIVVKPGFLPATVSLVLEAGRDHAVVVELLEQPEFAEEVVVVGATRTGKLLDDTPVRVEILDQEEIEEKTLMMPGDVVMLLNETGGLRVQATSPGLGAASVRIQGMRGRYTRFLSDGLPLFGQQVAGLGLLQVPPMDLGQVEVIKGVASALYGAGALGGVVNLTSRRPGSVPERELLLNRTSLGGTDAVMWLASPMRGDWGVSFLGSGHWHARTDRDGDPWSDLPAYTRGVVRPRIHWDDGGGRSFFATFGTTYEDRTGGTMPDLALPQTGQPYPEALETRRFDGGVVGQFLLGANRVATARFAAVSQRHTHLFGEVLERDRHDNLFGEFAIRGHSGSHTWVVGAAIERDIYEPRDVPRFRYRHTTPGIFVQDDVDLTSWLTVSASGRLDAHSEYGTFFSPRVSGLLRWGDWVSRASIGTGFFAPTPLTEETEAAGLTRLAVPRPLTPERGRTVSADVSRSLGPVTATITLFGSRVSNPVDVDRDGRFTLLNLSTPTTTAGVELLGTYRLEPFFATVNYAYVRGRETESGVRTDIPLTPRHSAGVVGMWEQEGRGRIGLELFYTGRQRLEVNPFRQRSEPYVVMGVLVERRFGGVRLFLNAENITDVRQTRWDPLIRPTRGSDGRWTVDAWAPLEGRVINGGVRWEF